MAFASIDTGYPNLKQRIGWSDGLPEGVKQKLILRGARLVSGFQETPRALAADDAIDNRDRNLGNILWDGASVAWIDHERALGLAGPCADQNKLAELAKIAGQHATVSAAAVALALTLGQQAVDEAQDVCSSLQSVDEFAQQVSSRLVSLANRVLDRFPKPIDLFNQGK
jgi:hypothetical protein